MVTSATQSDLDYTRSKRESKRSSEAFRQCFFYSVHADISPFVTENYADETTCQKQSKISQRLKYRQNIFDELSNYQQCTKELSTVETYRLCHGLNPVRS